jgi:pimeloyl-ACP methyl ester carboxylesterase
MVGFRLGRNKDDTNSSPYQVNPQSESLLDPNTITRPRIEQHVSTSSMPRTFLPLDMSSRSKERRKHASFSNSIFPVEYPPETNYDSLSTDPMGLQLISDAADPSGDIIFVHGLGGTSLRTWSWKRDVANFWPLWLTEEDALASFRIFSFGYNSNFKGATTNLNTTDFAKELLFSLMTFSDGLKGNDGNPIPIGSRPMIFVAHSMGGLVVKKAYVLGKHDSSYAGLIAQLHGIIFLATPHRGAQYAKILNNILSTAPLGSTPKAYVAELDVHSSALQDINEQFRINCEELSLASFFETRKTSFGITKILVSFYNI